METKNIIVTGRPTLNKYAGRGMRWSVPAIVKVGNTTQNIHISAPTLARLNARLKSRGIQM